MTERLARLREKYFPPLAELYVLLLGLLAVFLWGGYEAIKRNTRLSFLAAGGMAGLLLMFYGGTAVCFPLYYTTNLGSEVALPGVPVSLNRAFAALLLGAAVFDFWRYRPRITWISPLVIFLLFNVYYITVTFLTRRPDSPIPVNSIYYLVPFFVLVALYWREEWLKRLLKAFLFVSLALVVLPGLIEFLSGRNLTYSGLQGTVTRINGFAQDSIVYSFMAMWILPFAVVFFIEAKSGLSKVFHGGAALSLIFVSLITENRQTPFILAAVLFVLLVFVRYRHKRLLLVGTFLAGILVAPFAIGIIADRLGTATNVMMDDSLAIRRDKFLIAQEIWKEHFWFGIGLDHFGERWREYIPSNTLVSMDYTDWRAHHVDLGYVQIMTEFGFIGFMIFAALIAASAFWIGKLYRISRLFPDSWHSNALAAVSASLALFLISNVIADAFVRLQTFYTFAILFALATSMRMRIRKAGGLEAMMKSRQESKVEAA